MKILSKTKGSAREYGRWSVNPYLGCPHQCAYCYLQNGIVRNVLGGSEVRLKKGIVNEEHAFHVTMGEIVENREQIIKDGGLFMSFVTDPMCRECITLFMLIIHSCMTSYDIPVVVLTKSVRFWNNSFYYKLRCQKRTIDERMPLAFGWTLTGHDQMEPGAPTNKQRLECMDIVHGDGFLVWASIEPVIDFPSSLRMVEQAVEAGCSHFKIGLQTYGSRVLSKMYDHDECVAFIHDVMRIAGNHATVYWKQSIRSFLGEEDYARAVIGYKGVVEADWNMFDSQD